MLFLAGFLEHVQKGFLSNFLYVLSSMYHQEVCQREKTLISNVIPEQVQEASLLQIDCHVIIYSPSGFIPRLFYYPMLSFRKHRILTTSPTYVYLLSSHLLSHLLATCVSQESNNCANLLFDTCALYKSVPEYSCVCNNLALSHEGANIIIRRLAPIMPPTPHNTHSVTHSLYKSTILNYQVLGS